MRAAPALQQRFSVSFILLFSILFVYSLSLLFDCCICELTYVGRFYVCIVYFTSGESVISIHLCILLTFSACLLRNVKRLTFLWIHSGMVLYETISVFSISFVYSTPFRKGQKSEFFIVSFIENKENKVLKMLDEAEYASSTDDSDEDYNPGNNDSDVPSEIESDGDAEHFDDDQSSENKRKRKGAVASTKTAAKSRKIESEISGKNGDRKQEEADKSKNDNNDDDDNEDALWASFLNKASENETKPVTTTKVTPKTEANKTEPTKTTVSASNINETTSDKQKPTKSSENAEKKTVVTEIFEFAGEKVEVQKEVKISDKQTNNSNESSSSATASKPLPFNKRISGGSAGSSGGGLQSILGQIGKKNKLSVLEKTKLDWTGFKHKEGIDEELQTHNKGRDGYLERQDFLQRTDVRQFQIEKGMRQTNRRK